MTVLQPDLIEASWTRIGQYGDLVPLRFYETLFMVHPELRAAFPTSMARQRRHLLAALDRIVTAVHDLPAALPYLARLGTRHHDLGITSIHYEQVAGALLSAFRAFDPEWNTDLVIQWKLAYSTVAAAMQDAADQADAGPHWYDLRAVDWINGWEAVVWLRSPQTNPAYWAAAGRHLLASPAGRPGLWRPYFSATADRVVAKTPPGLANMTEFLTPDQVVTDINGGAIVALHVPVRDHASRTLALAGPGTRVAVAPQEDQ